MTIQKHWYYHVEDDRWYDKDRLPAILGPGASITFDWERRDGYLTIGNDRDNFYWNPSPLLEDASFGQQSLMTNKKAKILFDSKRIIFSYSSEKPSYGEISIYNLYGKKIKTLFRGKMEKKEYQLIWDKKDEKKFSPGIYFLIINTKEKKERIKIIITH